VPEGAVQCCKHVWGVVGLEHVAVWVARCVGLMPWLLAAAVAVTRRAMEAACC
jgi:hypothetical protein